MVTTKELRKKLAKELSLPTIPDALWAAIEQGGYDEAVLATEAEDEWRDMVKEARRLLAFHRAMGLPAVPPQGTGGHETPASEGTWAARIATVQNYVAMVVAELPSVRRFRRRVLGGRLLSADAAGEFLNSPAIRLLPHSRFAELGVDIATHESQVVGRNAKSRRELSWPEGYSLHISSSHGTRRVLLGSFLPESIKQVLREERAERIPIVMKHSVFAELQAVSAELEARYALGWGGGLFPVLTGKCYIKPIDGWSLATRNEDMEQCTITLKVQPWVPADVVAKVYRIHQQGLLRGKNRPISPDLLPLLMHVASMKRQRKTWTEIISAWNRVNPGRPYGDVRNMSRDFQRLRRLILFPAYARYAPTKLPWS